MKLTVKDIDLIIEQGLNNITNMSPKSNVGNINLSSEFKSNQEDVSKLMQPIEDYMDNEEQLAKDKIQIDTNTKNFLKDPFQRKSKEVAIKNNQDRIKQIELQKSNIMSKQKELQQNSEETQKQIAKQMDALKQNSITLNNLKSQIKEMYDKNYSMPILKRAELPTLDLYVTEAGIGAPTVQEPNSVQQPIQPSAQPQVQQKRSSFKVKFESKSENPFEVLFSERGFRIGETRLSFEVIEEAISKNYILTLDNGQGLVLDAVRMQKILKYKNRTV